MTDSLRSARIPNPDSEYGLPHHLIEKLESIADGDVEKQFAEYCHKHNTRKWIIGTDFCISDANRPNDSFAFVVYPAGAKYEQLMATLNRLPEADLKDVKRPPRAIVRLLTRGETFGFCFVADRMRRLFASADDMRIMLDGTISDLEIARNDRLNYRVLPKLRALRQDVNKKSANLKLIENIFLTSTLCSYIVFLLCRHSLAEAVGWAPDRDKITESYDGIVYDLTHRGYAALCSNKGALPLDLFGEFKPPPENFWADIYVRGADYLAGAAAWDYPKHDAVPFKVAKLLEDIFTDNPYVHFFQISYFVDDIGMGSCDVSRVRMSSRPSKPGIELRPKNLRPLRGRSRILSK